jgi:CRP-like cAMP-binding protein
LDKSVATRGAAGHTPTDASQAYPQIYAEGQGHTALWQVMSSTVRVTNQNPDGKEVVFAIFSSGDCFGEISLLDGLAAANTATAMDQVELAELAKPDFDELYHQYPAFAHQLMRLMCGRVRHMLNFYADVTLRPLEQRMASRILYISGAQQSPWGSLELQCASRIQSISQVWPSRTRFPSGAL